MTVATPLTSLLNLARNVARQTCRDRFEPHVILLVFQYLRTNDAARRVYMAATGCVTGFERGHSGKEVANPKVGRAVAECLGAVATGEEPRVSGEFIEGYSVLRNPNWKPAT